MSRIPAPARPPPSLAAAGKLRLDDAVDYLGGPEGKDLLKQVKTSLEKQGADFKQVMGPMMGPERYKDAFSAKVAEALYGSFLLPSQTTATIPQAVAYALLQASDANGIVSLEKVKKQLGPEAAKLVAELIARIGDRAIPTQRRAMKYAHMPTGMPEIVAKSAIRQDLRPRMPALDAVSKAVGGEKALAGLKMIAVQHLFPTTETLFDELVQNGLDPKQTTLAGKNYSINQDVLYGMRSKGWNVPELPLTKLLTVNPDGTSREVSPIAGYLGQLFEGVDLKTAKKPSFLILDEGGKLLKALHENYPEFAPYCVAVEQTDRGVQVIEEMKAHGIELKCPVVNVARSQTKKELEAPMIGESIVHSTLEALTDAKVNRSDMPKEACVIGYGAVGKATADALRHRGYLVAVYDIDPKKMEQAAKDGCNPLPREQALARGHLTISCTGRTTITPDEFDTLLPNRAVLVNAASGNHELGMDKHEHGAGFLSDDPQEHVDELGFRLSDFGGKKVILGDIAGRDDANSVVMRSKSGRERLVLKSGYVVNMSRDIPPEFIQLTRGMLLGACLQAAKETKPGLVDLSQKVQQTVVEATRESLKPLDQTLETPDFRAIRPSES